MKIIQIASYYPPHSGGIENVTKEISERLARKNHQVEVFTSDVGCSKEEQLKSTKNLKIHYLPAKEIVNTPIIPSLYKELMKIPQDSIIHVHTAQAYVPEIVHKVCKKRNILYIAHTHGDPEPSSFFGKIFLKYYKTIFLRKFLRNAEKVIVLTEDYKALISKRYNIKKNKIIVIPNGVGKEFFTKEKRKNKSPHLLSVGRISVEKNLLRLIDSIRLCKSKFILDIVGDGSLLNNIKHFAKQQNIKNVIFQGRKTGKDLIRLYQNADIFVSTSNGEGFPLTILEAMASRLPIIASDVKGNHDVVNNVGILVNPPTPENFAKEIDRIFSNKTLYKQLSKKSLQFARAHNWDKIVSQTEQVYREVLAEHAKSKK